MKLNDSCARQCGKTCCGSDEPVFSRPQDRPCTIALAGQPNTGKSTLFNLITGANQHVGNWPGKTVEKKEGVVRYGGQTHHIFDLPGTYSLSSNSLEETIARDFILDEKPDVVVVVVDATQPERSFYMVAEIALLGAPMVVALNKIDLAERQGIAINAGEFERQTGMKTVPISASKRHGLDELLSAVSLKQGAVAGITKLPDFDKAFGPSYARIINKIEGWSTDGLPKSWLALKLLEGDRQVQEMIKAGMDQAQWHELASHFPRPEEGQVIGAKARYDWIKSIIAPLFERKSTAGIERSRFDIAATHPFWGKIIAAMMLLASAIAAYAVTMPLMLPGLVLIFVSDSVQGFLAKFTPLWFSAMIGDGLMGGMALASIITGFIGAVFLVLGIMENTGYLARLAYVFDPFMRRLGLHGKSVLPLIMGFVCNILGVAASRVIDTWRQRLATLIIAPIIPCKGLFIVVGFVTAAFFGGEALLIILALAVVTLLYMAATAKLLKLGVLKEAGSGLIMELPHYQRPDLRTVVTYAWTRLKIFFFRGFWFVVFFAVLAWVGVYFPNGSVHDSYLAQFGKALEPYGQIMGWEWRLCVSYIVAVFSKEGTLSAMAIIFGVATAPDTDLVVMSMDQNVLEFIMQGGLTSYLATTGISPAGALSFIFAVFFSLPCFGTLAMIYSETKSIKWTCFTFVYYLSASLIMGMLAYRVGLLLF